MVVALFYETENWYCEWSGESEQYWAVHSGNLFREHFKKIIGTNNCVRKNFSHGETYTCEKGWRFWAQAKNSSWKDQLSGFFEKAFSDGIRSKNFGWDLNNSILLAMWHMKASEGFLKLNRIQQSATRVLRNLVSWSVIRFPEGSVFYIRFRKIVFTWRWAFLRIFYSDIVLYKAINQYINVKISYRGRFYWTFGMHRDIMVEMLTVSKYIKKQISVFSFLTFILFTKTTVSVQSEQVSGTHNREKLERKSYQE